MKPVLIFTLIFASTAAAVSAQAQTYQWKDSNGRTVISDTPPPGSARDARTMGGAVPGSTSATGKPSEAPKSFAEKDMEFRKRQMESTEKADKEAKEKAAAKEKKDSCDRAKRQLAALESGQRVSTTDANGERRFIDDAERQQEIERSRKFVAETCK